MSFGYYRLVRFAALMGFAILAYDAPNRANKIEMIVYLCLAILFQPFIIVSFGRTIGNVFDIIVGCALEATIFIKPKSFNNYES